MKSTSRRRSRPIVASAAAAVVGLIGLAWMAGASAATPAAPTASPAIATGMVTQTPTPAPAPAESAKKLSVPQSIVLGVIEGVTEFLPISSTGHLIVTERLLHVDLTDKATKDAADAYAIVIQAGAILAVVVLYWRRLLSVANGLIGRDEAGRRLLIALVVGFLPVVPFALVESKVKDKLFGPWPVVAAWIVGGVVLLLLSSRGWLDRERHGSPIESITWKQALVVGIVQCLALWPGTSRSLVTIVAALLIGISLSGAVEFSFLLGLVTLGAATVLDLAKHHGEITESFGVAAPVAGFVAAFVAAVIAIRWLVSYIQNHSLAIFGWYRIAVAVIVAGLLVAGTITV